jgi:hypothetical protein
MMHRRGRCFCRQWLAIAGSLWTSGCCVPLINEVIVTHAGSKRGSCRRVLGASQIKTLPSQAVGQCQTGTKWESMVINIFSIRHEPVVLRCLRTLMPLCSLATCSSSGFCSPPPGYCKPLERSQLDQRFLKAW